MDQLASLIRSAEHIILSTHRQCDGDGLGAELALYFALRKMGKKVKVVNVDKTPKKYRYLQPDKHIQYFTENTKLPFTKADLVLVFDTNDERLLEPLVSELKKICKTLAFVDHHPILKEGPAPSKESLIDVNSASTGEIAYRLIKALGVALDKQIAVCLYTSIAFDTQLFRFIRNSANSHLIAAELLSHDIEPESVHKFLFGNQTVQKMAFLAKTLGQIEYHSEGRLAVLKLKDEDLFHYNLEPDESRDVIDMLMNIETLEAAALFRQDGENQYKLSLRSKGAIPVLPLAESLGGGGHVFAAGAFLVGDFDTFKTKVVKALIQQLSTKKKPA